VLNNICYKINLTFVKILQILSIDKNFLKILIKETNLSIK